MFKRKITNICEFSGSVLAMVYAILIASNTGNETLGFSCYIYIYIYTHIYLCMFPKQCLHLEVLTWVVRN